MYRRFAPQPPLDQYISCYWMMRVRSPDARTGELIVPDGHSDLVFCLRAPLLRHPQGSGTDAAVQVASSLEVARTSPIRVQLTGAVDVVGIRFRLGGLAAFQPAAMYELTDGPIEAIDVFESPASLLEEQLAETDLPQERVAILDEFLVTRLAPPARLRLVEHVLDTFRTPAGRQQTLSEIAARLGCSGRTLRRAFRRLVGRSPKTCARLLRFQDAWRSIRTPSSRSYASLAYQWGYYDQPHFIREFKQFAGMTPAQCQTWLQERAGAKRSGWGGAMPPGEYRSWILRRTSHHQPSALTIE